MAPREVTREDLAGAIRAALGSELKIKEVTRLAGGTTKGVYRLTMDNSPTVIAYLWEDSENYWPQAPNENDVADPFSPWRGDSSVPCPDCGLRPGALGGLSAVGCSGMEDRTTLGVMADSPSSPHVTDPAGSADMGRLAVRCGDLKRELVAFAESPRFDRWREQELAKAASAGEDGAPARGSGLDRGSERWIQAMDDFIMAFRFPDETGVIDRFLAARGKDLRKPDRKILEGWLDPVDGIFELRTMSSASLMLYHLIDELEYLVYGSMDFTRLPAEPGDFILARIVPMAPGAWTVSGTMAPFPRAHARIVAELALEWAGTRPRAAFRNPEKAELGWEMMREDRDEFVEFFGSDQVILPAGEVEGRVNAYYRQHQEKALARRSPDKPLPEVSAGIDRPFFAFPEELLTLATIGVIYDETDGMSLLPDFGMLEELFADPSVLATDSRYAEALLGYLNSDSIYPNSLRRLAAAHPDTVDEVYRTVLRKPSFTWAKQGELLLRKRKPWYFKRPPYPKVTPTSEYLVELLSSPLPTASSPQGLSSPASSTCRCHRFLSL